MHTEWSHSHPVLARLLGRTSPAGMAAVSPSQLDVEEIRQRNLAMLQDCQGPALPRVRRCVNAARSAQDLWMLRCELYQVVSCSHGEPEAMRRIHALVPSFEGWVPPQALQRARAAAA